MIGAPLNRVDGPLKVTGRAVYASEDWSFGQPLYAFIVQATIGHGKLKTLDTSRAERAPGVRKVLTHRNIGKQGKPDMSNWDEYARAYPMMASDQIRFHGDPIALVVAETHEQARAAAGLVEVTYDITDGHYVLDAREGAAFVAKSVNAGFAPEVSLGDLDGAMAKAPVKIDQVYTTPYELSLPMEPHNCLAVWNGDAVTVHLSTQIVKSACERIAATLQMDPAKVTVISRYIGGGFGSKLGVHAETILAVIAARAVGQPVKIVLTRQQMFHLNGNRPATRQRVQLGAEHDGTLTAFGHDVVMKLSTGDDYVEQTATSGRSLYAAPNRKTVHRVVELDLPNSEDVRAPGEAPGLLAIECAMDELASTLRMDPIELRIKNEPAKHPETGVPFSDRRLVECMQEGARLFGWDKRPVIPGSMREGRWLIGYGMAAAIRPHFQFESEVRVRIDSRGIAVVQSDMTDIGTGTYTIVTQIVAEALGLPVERVHVELGHSDFPKGGGSGGSWGAGNTATAAHRACVELRQQITAAAVADAKSPLHGLDAGAAAWVDGRIVIGNASEALTDVLARGFPTGIEAIGKVDTATPAMNLPYSLNTYGAHFAEVRVDADTGEVRLHRMLGVFVAGRIFNAKTARSQLLGGMIWGASAALHEEAVVDERYGSFINHDLASYLMPVHADIPNVEVVILDSFDDKANELGAKGVGELGICGAGAAVANAVFNATGVRVREFPITIEKLLPGLP